jgi:hypothetical protein
MDFSASAATKDAVRHRRRRSCTPARFSSTPPSLVPLIKPRPGNLWVTGGLSAEVD